MIKKVLNVNGIDRTLIVDQEALLCDVLRKHHWSQDDVEARSG